ncbi:nephrocystin-4-like [Amphiura filiformis]|uniref:nephrocystin-4-like n=1 Tax=Amphiura filiformis TaxID=82378 RepID=UPI003B21FBA0
MATVSNRTLRSWKAFFGIHGNAVAFAGERSDEVETNPSKPYCLYLQGIESVVRPKEEGSIEYEVRLNLFDITYKRFFGRTWVGPRKRSKTSVTNKVPKLQYNVPVYFHTSLADPNIVVVVEVIGILTPKKGRSQHVSCGWGVLRLFQQGDFVDTSHTTPAPKKKVDLYHGSPRALLYLGDDIKVRNMLVEYTCAISNCQFSFTIRTHRYMEKIMHLVPENYLVDAKQVVPGVTIVDPRDGGDNLRKPRPLKKTPCVIDKIKINLYPTLEKFEEELCQIVNNDRLARDGVQSDTGSVVIAERRLHVGIHNGFGYVDNPHVMMITTDDEFSRGGKRGVWENLATTLLVKNKISLSSIVDDPLYSVVFLLEYNLSVPVSKQDQQLSTSFNRNQTRSVALRWAVYAPNFKEHVSDVTVQLIGGPVPNADNVFMYKNPDTAMADKETSKAASGKIQFVFKVKKEGYTSRPMSPVSQMSSNEPHHRPMQMHGCNIEISFESDLMLLSFLYISSLHAYNHLTLLISQADLEDGHHDINAQYPSVQSLRSQTSGTEISEQPPVSGRPPIYKGTPRTPKAYMGMSPSPQVPPLQLPPSPMQQMPYQHQQQYQSPQQQYQMHGSQYNTQQGAMMHSNQYGGTQQQQGVGTKQYPVEIRHLEEPTPRTDRGDQLQEIPYAPVHAPIMPLGPYHRSGPGLSRAAYARLYQAGFPEIKARSGDLPEVIDPGDRVTFNPQRENADPLQCNEIVIQFLAFSRVLQFQPSIPANSPRTVFFTFQFYRYPPATTQRLLLGDTAPALSNDPESLPCILHRLGQDDKKSDIPPGWTTKYSVDPGFMKPGEGRLFVKHLFQQTLHIDVWDGDSLLLIGSCSVELKHLLRGGRSAVQVTHELDIITTEYSDDSSAMTGDLMRSGSVRPVGVTPILKGRLHLRLANIGHSAEAKVLKAGTLPIHPSKVVVHEDGSGAFLGGSLNLAARQTGLGLANLRQKRSYLASHMSETDRELATALLSKQERAVLQEANREGDSKRQRKLARMQAVRQAKTQGGENGLGQSLLVKKEEKLQRTRDLKTIEIYRERTKKDGILNMLQSVITTEHTVHPSFGHAEFFEFVLKNPYNIQHTISIQWEDPDLSIITEPREWRHFKQLFETYTPVEENMFNVEDQTQVTGMRIFLRPKESVNVPFKYQCFKADQSVQSQGPHIANKPNFKIQVPQQDKDVDLALQSRNVKVQFKTQDSKPIAILSLNIEPQPHVIDQTFRFHHPEQSFLKKSVRLPPFHSLPGTPAGGSALGELFVRCSDDNIICETKKVPPGEPQDVYLKVPCGASPSVKKFFVLIYTNQFLSVPVQTWQFYIHALQRVDINCVEGQTSKFSLILRGTHASRLVHCYTSHPNEMQVIISQGNYITRLLRVDINCVEGQTSKFSLILRGTHASRLVHCYTSHPNEMKMNPSEQFMLAANSVHEVEVGVRPLAVGCKFMYINVVDTEYHQLIRSWLICVTCRQPVISKAFELQLPVGGGKGSNKKITYTNPYPQMRVFLVGCNRDDLLQFKETRLEIGGGESIALGLRFAPCQQSGVAEIMIFINDEQDKNEETFLVKAIYS